VSQSKQVFTREHTPFEELHNIDIGQRIGYELTMECLGSETPVSCFIAANYFIAYGVLDALAEKGLRDPEDYSVCGFNNLSSSRISNVGLTTVEHQTDSRARHAFSILMERIKGNASQTGSSIWNTRISCWNGALRHLTEKTAPRKNNGHAVCRIKDAAGLRITSSAIRYSPARHGKEKKAVRQSIQPETP
jgi:hypothetical protein